MITGFCKVFIRQFDYIVLILLVIIIVLVILSVLKEEPQSDKKLEEWEEEIIEPNNTLNPLAEKSDSDAIILNLANKIENTIDKFFDVIIGVVEKAFDTLL